MTWLGKPRGGTGICSQLHKQRGAAMSAICGMELVPGSLNLTLDRTFDYSAPHRRGTIPDPVDWREPHGTWHTNQMWVWDVWVGGIPCCVIRLGGSTSGPRYIEVVSDRVLREAIQTWPTLIRMR